MKRLLKSVTVAALIGNVSVFAEPLVTDVVAKQRFPWNGLVDITCKVAGIDGAVGGYKFSVEAVMPDSGNVRKVSRFWVVRNGTNSIDYAVSGNGNHRLLWNAQADLGAAIYSNMVVRVALTAGSHSDIHGKVQLWEGGPYWATTNIGAEKPEDYGYYFWWGDTVGYKREHEAWVASDGSSSHFSFGEPNTPTHSIYMYIVNLKKGGWITVDEVLAPEHDAAHVHWGGAWRMPTWQELNSLLRKCDWTWTTMNGVYGYRVSGKGVYSSNSIFLPFAGNGSGTSLDGTGSNGCYWSSEPELESYAMAECLEFDSGNHYMGSSNRSRGRSVRPVQGFNE